MLSLRGENGYEIAVTLLPLRGGGRFEVMAAPVARISRKAACLPSASGDSCLFLRGNWEKINVSTF